MNTLPKFSPNQSANEINKALKSALQCLEKAQHCSVQLFGEIQNRQLYLELGFSSINQYAEVELGFSSSRTGYFKKLCKDMKRLPKIREKIESGELGWTKARIITGITDDSNQDEMLEFALTNPRVEVEQMVRKKKLETRNIAKAKITRQRPLLPEPELRQELPRVVLPVRVTMEMTPVQFAKYELLWEQLRKKMNLPADKINALLEVMAGCLENEAHEKTTRVVFEEADNTKETSTSKPPFQIHVHHCPECDSAKVQTNKGEMEIGNVELESAKCDCIVSVLGQRNKATIPPSIRNLVLTRARHKCQRKGCHHTGFLEVHHMVPGSEGGTNDPANLQVLCSACHALEHEKQDVFMVKSPGNYYHWKSGALQTIDSSPTSNIESLITSGCFQSKPRLVLRYIA